MPELTLARLQQYIKDQDYYPDLTERYFMHLTEEIGELSRAMRSHSNPATPQTLKGSVEEEIYDVIYYALAIANCYDIDVERWVYAKEQLNDQKYGRHHADSLLDAPRPE